jgi:peroxiredoxin/outer membrane lipoprotein-sorting protein
LKVRALASHLTLVIAVAVVTTLAPIPARASDAAASSGPSTDGAALLSTAAAALQSAYSVSAQFTEIDTYAGSYRDLKQSGTVTLVHPNKLRVDIQRFRRVDASHDWAPSGNDAISDSDGTTYWYAFVHPHSTQIRQHSVSNSALRDALKPAEPLADFFGTNAGQAPFGASGAVSIVGSQQWLGATYTVVQFTTDSAASGQPATVQAFVGSDNLVHRLISTSQSFGGVSTREWDLSNITIGQAVPDSRFAYAPPADATVLDDSPRPDSPIPGDIAPDFTVTDRSGHAVKLSDFRGKTVILDYWATWCWPCNQSLPHTEQVAATYKSSGVVALAVAIWDSQTGFDKWTSTHYYPDIDFAIDPSPQGKDVASALYGVTTTPTAFVIDPAGRIVRKIAGYAGPSQELAEAVQSAISSKTASAR